MTLFIIVVVVGSAFILAHSYGWLPTARPQVTTATPPQHAAPPPATAGGGATHTPNPTPPWHAQIRMPSWGTTTWSVLLALVALIILSALNWEYPLMAWGFAEKIGFERILSALFVIALFVALMKVIPSGLRDSAITVAALALVIFGIYTYWPSSWFSYSTPMRIQNAAKSTLCNGELQVVELDATPRVINPNGRCIVHYRVEGAVVLIDSRGNTLRVDEKPSNNPTFWPESARSAQKSTVRMHYKLNTS